MEFPSFGTWMVPVSCRDLSALCGAGTFFVPARDTELSQQGDSPSLEHTHFEGNSVLKALPFTRQVPAISRAGHCSGEAVKRLGGTRRTALQTGPRGTQGRIKGLLFAFINTNLIYCSPVPRGQRDPGLDTVRVTAQFHSCVMVLPKGFSYHWFQNLGLRAAQVYLLVIHPRGQGSQSPKPSPTCPSES